MRDRHRTLAGRRSREDEIAHHIEDVQSSGQGGVVDPYLNGEIPDDTLSMLFVCCDPILPAASRIQLALRTLCGFEIPEIARVFFITEEALEKRLVRARKALRENSLGLAAVTPHLIAERLNTVLRTVYCIFNEGYFANVGDDPIRHDIAEQGIRFGKLLCDYPLTATPRTHALMALMMFHSSRFEARLSADGELLDIWEQDRAKWDKMRIHSGFSYLQRATQGEDLSSYHLEALISAIHVRASSAKATDWATIATLYDQLYAMHASPVVLLQRIIADGFARGPEGAIAAWQRAANMAPGLAHQKALQHKLGTLQQSGFDQRT